MWQLFNENTIVTHTLTSAGTKVALTRGASSARFTVTETNGVTTMTLPGAGFMSYYLYDYRYIILHNGLVVGVYEFTADNPYAVGTEDYPLVLATNDTVALRLEVRRKVVITDSLSPVCDTGYATIGGSVKTYLNSVRMKPDSDHTGNLITYKSFHYTENGSLISRGSAFPAGDYSYFSNYDLVNYNYIFLLYARNTNRNLIFEPRYDELTSDTPITPGADILNFDYLRNPFGREVIYDASLLQFRMVIYALPKSTSRVKVNGSWKRATGEFCKVNGSWKRVVRRYSKINGAWKGSFK